jgi:apolipoprotein D and lipocalin family protein
MLKPVTGFDASRYLGTWYEIARLPHHFEKNLKAVSATYTIREDGSIDVLNQGYDSVKKKWKSAQGRACFKQGRDTALLRVTFFWPSYGEYKVILLDKENYAYAVVTSGTYKYLWIFARTPTLEEEALKKLVEFARKSGFEVSQIVFVDQEINGG